jgi:hypothetical protein
VFDGVLGAAGVGLSGRLVATLLLVEELCVPRIFCLSGAKYASPAPTAATEITATNAVMIFFGAEPVAEEGVAG